MFRLQNNPVGRHCLVTALLMLVSLPACVERPENGRVHTATLRSNSNGSAADPVPPNTLPDDVSIVLSESSGLDEYLVLAASNNAGLEAAFNQWKAALQRIPQVTALPDPRFTYRNFIQEVETRVGPQEQAFGLSQTFPWLAKLRLRGDVAAEAAEVARQRYEGRRQALFYEVADAYHELYYLGRAIAIVRENVDLVAHLESVARARYRTAAAGHPDVIRAQVELGKLEDQLAALVDLRAPVAARLNAALNRPSNKALPFPKQLPNAHLAATDDEILAWLAETNPELRALNHEIAKADLKTELARQDYYPDLTLGVDYTDVGTPPRPPAQGFGNPAAVRSASRVAGGMGDLIDAYALGRSFSPGSRPDDAGQDVWMVSLSMNVPLWRGKYAAGEREARAQKRAAQQNRRQRGHDLQTVAQRALYQYRDAVRKIDLYRDTLIPKALESIKSTETAFRAGSASFLDLVDAERTLLEFGLSYERALANRAQRIAELEKLTGRSLPRRSGPESEDQPQDDVMKDSPAIQGAD